MKKLLSAALLSLIIIGSNSCSKQTCSDVNSPNYGSEGTCTDLTTSIVGVYSGQIQNSSGGVVDTASQTMTVTKVDNSHISVMPSDITTNLPFQAKITLVNGSYLVSITAGTYNGKTYTGNPITQGGYTTNGYYNTSTRTFASSLTFDDGNGNIITESFMGNK